MTKQFLMIVCALSSLSAAAAEPANRLAANVVAQVRTLGGFGPPQVRDFGVQIFADGSVVSFNRSSNPAQVLFARLSTRKVADFRQAAAQLRISPLIALDAGRPPCLDAPTTEYVINTVAGAMVIARTQSCLRFVDQDSAALLEALKGVQAIDSL